MVIINFEKGLGYCFKNGENWKFSADRTIQTNHYSPYLLITIASGIIICLHIEEVHFSYNTTVYIYTLWNNISTNAVAVSYIYISYIYI